MRNFLIPNEAYAALVFGLAFTGFGLLRLFGAVQAGLTQGFGPKATMAVMGKLGYHTISLQGELQSSGLSVIAGVVLLGVSFWLIRRANTRPPI